MVEAIMMIAIVLVVAAGFWLTRGTRGVTPLDAQGRALDAKAHISPMGEPMSFDDDFKPPQSYY